MALDLYFLRHGQTDHSRENLFCGSGSNPGLTAHGSQMASDFANTYRTTRFTALYCSPLERAKQTVRPLEEVLAIKAQEEPALREIGYGQWEGKSVAEVSEQFHEDYVRWNAEPGWNAPTGGESGVVIAKRFTAFLEAVLESHSEGRILFVSHKATIRVALCTLLGVDVGRFRSRFDCPVASLSVVRMGRGGPMLRSLADRSHLPNELRELPGT